MSAPETHPAHGKQAGSAAHPFSIRLTDKERRLLETRAGGQPLGPYVRDLVLADKSSAARGRGVKSLPEREAMARVLAALGRSGIATHLGQLAKAASIGTLDLTPETAGDIREACKAVVAMRSELVRALGLKERERP